MQLQVKIIEKKLFRNDIFKICGYNDLEKYNKTRAARHIDGTFKFLNFDIFVASIKRSDKKKHGSFIFRVDSYFLIKIYGQGPHSTSDGELMLKK